MDLAVCSRRLMLELRYFQIYGSGRFSGDLGLMGNNDQGR